MLPRVLDPCKRHSSKERAKLHSCAAMLTGIDGWMGAGAGWLGRATQHLRPWWEVVALAAYGWVWGFLYGAIMNLWFWPFARGGALDWNPTLGLTATLERYWAFYVATSLPWDAAAALTNAVLILVTGVALMRTLRRFAHRLDPAVIFVAHDATPHEQRMSSDR